MADTINDDVNKQAIARAVQQQQGNTFMDYLKKHKWLVLGLIILLIFLIWWFCVRKTNTVPVETATIIPGTNVALPSNVKNIKVTRVQKTLLIKNFLIFQ